MVRSLADRTVQPRPGDAADHGGDARADGRGAGAGPLVGRGGRPHQGYSLRFASDRINRMFFRSEFWHSSVSFHQIHQNFEIWGKSNFDDLQEQFRENYKSGTICYRNWTKSWFVQKIENLVEMFDDISLAVSVFRGDKIWYFQRYDHLAELEKCWKISI